MASRRFQVLEEQPKANDVGAFIDAFQGSESSDSENSSFEQPRLFGDFLTPAQWLYCCFALVAEVCLVWLWQHPEMHLGSTPNPWTYSIAHMMLLCLYPRHAPGAGVEEAPAAPPATATLGAAKARSMWLDTLKIFTTQLVLIHHSGRIFGNNNAWLYNIGVYSDTSTWMIDVFFIIPDQSYFMSLLFFVSGIHVPSSLERKGTTEYVRDKLKRLGWPLMVQYFVITPLSTWLAGLAFGCEMPGIVRFGEGVCWFLTTLIIFSIAYALTPIPQVSLQMPSFVQVVFACMLLGAFQGWMNFCGWTTWAPFVSNGPAAYMDVNQAPLGAAPHDVAFFAAGCIAKRNGWLESFKEMSGVSFWSARILAIVLILVNPFRYFPGDKIGVVFVTHSIVTTVLLGVWQGIMTAALSVSVLHFFAVHGESRASVVKYAADSQYAVYVQQHLTFVCATCVSLKIMGVLGHTVEFEYDADRDMLTNKTGVPLGILIVGWLSTIVMVTMLAWPLGYLSRKLPFVKDVL
mmetsp:Transcript_34933/g.96595  ORF Transcript_34933/g.96595 Transcript_34933/m.96595 type:complete len:517 (-) Transcript_34933:121-1671(-)